MRLYSQFLFTILLFRYTQSVPRLLPEIHALIEEKKGKRRETYRGISVVPVEEFLLGIIPEQPISNSAL